MTESLSTDGLCIGGAEHDWRTEWAARAPWHGRTEWRSQCRRCGLRRARIAFAPPDEDAEEGTVVIGGLLDDVVPGTHYLSAADVWDDDPEQGPDLSGIDMDDPDARERAFAEAIGDGKMELAWAIARQPLRSAWPEDLRRAWGPRRDLAAMAAGRSNSTC